METTREADAPSHNLGKKNRASISYTGFRQRKKKGGDPSPGRGEIRGMAVGGVLITA